MGVSFRFVREMVVAALASYRTIDRSIDPTQHTFFPPSCDAAATILCWAAMARDLHTCIHRFLHSPYCISFGGGSPGSSSASLRWASLRFDSNRWDWVRVGSLPFRSDPIP